jgi:hypothetical protein
MSWRQSTGAAFAWVSQFSGPSKFARDIFLRQFPQLEERFTVLDYGTDVSHRSYSVAFPAPGEKPRVLFLGNLDRAKGFHLVKQTVESEGASDFSFFHAGALSGHVPGDFMKQYGPYRNEDLGTVLSWARPHLAVIFSLWGETHSFVLSEVLALSVPVVVSPRGALAERWPFYVEDENSVFFLDSLRVLFVDEKRYADIVQAAHDWLPPRDEDIQAQYRKLVQDSNPAFPRQTRFPGEGPIPPPK